MLRSAAPRKTAGLLATAWAVTLLAWAGGQDATPQEITDSVGMRFRLIPAGSFLMGSEGGQPDERPVHRVRLSAFYMGVHEVTQEQYEAVVGVNPSRDKSPTLPVETVSWADAQAYCGLAGEREGRVYRLPTEAEWEYAARGGREEAEYLWGDEPLVRLQGPPAANVADESFAAAFPEDAGREGYLPGYDDGYARTAPVGSFAPNGYGLYDMLGNVFEWCSDPYILGTQYYAESPVENPTGPASGPDRVMRGASWWAAPTRFHRVASRFRATPSHASAGVGFRCVREVGSR